MGRPLWLPLLASLAVAALACGEAETDAPRGGGGAPTDVAPASTPEAPWSPNAQPGIVRELRADRGAERAPADRGGRAWIVPDESGALPEARVGERGRFQLAYEAGPSGIAVGGSVQLQVSPFWGWSEPQVEAPDGLGFTRVTTAAEGVSLSPSTRGGGLLVVEIGGRPLAAGERIDFVYGAGEAGARVDRYAEERSPFLFAVDGDGDGIRAFLDDAPVVAVRAGPPEALVVTLPSVARVGEVVTLRAAVLDAVGNTDVDWEGTLEVVDAPEELLGSRLLEVARSDGGRGALEFEVTREGLLELRVRARTAPGEPRILEAVSNPLLVDADLPRIRWADLHGHSALSDGTGTPDAFYRYARDVAGLDVAALTDHDHWGIPFLDESPENQAEIRRATEAHHEPGAFVAIHGYEWTSWLFGHRHVLHFGDDEAMAGSLHSSLDERTDTPTELWSALRGEPALTFAHHSAGSPIATSWEIAPDPELEPLTEVTSVHGNSESREMPNAVGGALPGNFVPDALMRGYRLGFIGSGDSHDGHPGLAHLLAGTGGLAAIQADTLDRQSVLEALRARRTYATNGPRIVLDVRLDGAPMGSVLPPVESAELRIDVAATEIIEKVEVMLGREVVAVQTGDGRRVLALASEVGPLPSGSSLYVRLIQRGGGAAWSSPFFIDEAATGD